MRLTDTIKSADDLTKQYKDSANLNARSAIYRFSDGKGWGPDAGFTQMLEKIPVNADVLELGCGPGGLWKNRIDRVPQNWRIVLTDVMPGMVNEASAALTSDARFRVKQMDAQSLDLPDESFDAVVANHMLYHVEDRARALGEIRRVLKPNGWLFAATNSELHLAKIRKLLDEFIPNTPSILAGELPFSLENGQGQLRSFFEDVTIQCGPSELRVKEAEAVVQYVLSVGDARETLVGPRLDALRKRVQAEIDACGTFLDQANAGMFIARRVLSQKPCVPD